ncbi:MAG: discoidin domain-containing protein [Bacteroidaceae bacterium]|nr:discoidin domain-containing protein [Bacteroidaceae bacterium]
MKKFTFLIVALLTMIGNVNAEVDPSLAGKMVSGKGDAATTIDTNAWYLLYNCGRRLYVSEETTSFRMRATSNFETPIYSDEIEGKAGYMFQFVATANENEYYIKSGNGLYFTLTHGDSNVSSDPVAYVIAQIGDNAGHFYGQMVSDGRILNGNAGGGTLAGWGTDIPTSTGDNADYQFIPVILEEPSTTDFTNLNNAIAATNTVLTNAGYTFTIGDNVPLQIESADQAGYVSVSQPAVDGDVLANAFDNNPATLYHSNWSTSATNHYMQIDLGEAVNAFQLNYTTRQSGNNAAPYAITISGSNDGQNFTTITELSKYDCINAIPASNGLNYTNIFAADEAYRYVRLDVTSSPNGNNSFGIAEMSINKVSLTGDQTGTKMRYATIYNAILAATAIANDETTSQRTADDMATYLNNIVSVVTVTNPIEFTTDFENPVCYVIKSSRVNQNWTNPYWTLSGNGISITQFESEDELLADINSYWFFVEDKNTGLISMYPYGAKEAAMGFKAVDDEKDKLTNIPANYVGVRYQLIVNDGDYPYALRPYGYNTYVSNYGGGTNLLGFYNDVNDHGTRFALIKKNPASNPNLKPNITINWTTDNAAMWGDAITEDLPAVVITNASRESGKTVHKYETAFEIATSTTITATFQWTGGSCGLNIVGFDIVDENGNIVAGDYHSGFTGGQPRDNIYTVNVAEAGSYTARCYVWANASDRLNATAGTITIAFSAVTDASVFDHAVTFAAEYATLYLGYNVTIPTGVEAYYITGEKKEGFSNVLMLTQVEGGAIPACTAVILKKTGEDASYTFNYSESATAISTNLLKGSIADRYVAADAYVLGLNNNTVGLYKATLNQLEGTAFLNNANKAYMIYNEDGNNIASYNLSFDWGGTTGIENIEDAVEENATKAIYDITGRQIKAITVPGIYIINGKKTFVK